VAALGEAIAKRIGEPRYKLWFEGHTCFRWDGDVLTVGVPNRHFEEWLQKTFVGAVRESAAEVFGAVMQIRFTIDPELFREARQEQAERGARSAEREAPKTEGESAKPEDLPTEEEEEEARDRKSVE
jgi:chromosomal replication initiation ATPase DnaA